MNAFKVTVVIGLGLCIALLVASLIVNLNLNAKLKKKNVSDQRKAALIDDIISVAQQQSSQDQNGPITTEQSETDEQPDQSGQPEQSS